MHNNFYFIRKLVVELRPMLQNLVLMECFSQNKDELVLSFLGNNKKEVHIVANLSSDFSCLYFPEEFHRARKNSVSLFTQILGLRVTNIIQVPNERLFVMEFNEGFKMAFKLFGNRSNILLLKDESLVSIFKNNLKQDKDFVLNEQGRVIDFSFQNFQQQEFNIKKTYFTLGEIPEKYLETQGYNSTSSDKKFELITEMFRYLESPDFFVTKVEDKVILSLFNIGNVISKHSSAVEAINAFYSAHFRYNYLEKVKSRLLSLLDTKIKSVRSYIENCNYKIQELSEKFPVEKIADIIMANLHLIPSGAEEVTLFDFYREQNISIQLKKDVSPQKHAEALYKKSKKRPMEMTRLEDQLSAKGNELQLLQEERSAIDGIVSHKELEPFVKRYILLPEKEHETPSLKFKECEFSGYKIYVGKSAENNDELTQKFAGKDDLWLHAKDVQGSHVIIKFRSGQNFPKPVIEKAASLAAFYSKRRNETLCPVIYTQKKNVRKVKGAPKGAVKVEKESIIMVEPKDF